jgi:hypothetical protein
VDVAKAWLDGIDEHIRLLEQGVSSHESADLKQVYTLKEDKKMGWTTDIRWEGIMRLAKALPGENTESKL